MLWLRDRNITGTLRPRDDPARTGLYVGPTLNECLVQREELNGHDRKTRSVNLPGCVMNGFQHSGAFVIQFRAGSDFESGRIEGRVEHIASGESARFDSAAALLAIFARLIREAPRS
jgi:hypothetical protein